MKMDLIFATHNRHKVSEVQAMLPAGIHVRSLSDLGCDEDIPETADTLQGNALQKAQFVHERYHCNCFADDTGLEIDALDGRPGVYSARYAGEGCSFDDNVRKVLAELENVPLEQRTARFRTVVALILDGRTYFFEGKVEGLMTLERHGVEGFGYDPIFLPEGYGQTFAEMDASEKNRISHRGRAMAQMVGFLERL
ncbi:MAG: non-canonical purine NTP diphosphatase [Bacteroidales bacterium]|nr:non-canonical purine NTP diphosphatase [Bacteroidales bacterium]